MHVIACAQIAWRNGNVIQEEAAWNEEILPTVVRRLRISFHKCLAAKRSAVISTDMPDKRDKSGGVILFGGLSRIMPFLPPTPSVRPNWVELD